MKNPFSYLIAQYNRLRARIVYDRAVRMAEDAFAKTGQRQYIIKAANRKLIVVDRASFRLLKRKRYIKQTAHVFDLERKCLYHTSYANGTKPMSSEQMLQKRKEALDWLADR